MGLPRFERGPIGLFLEAPASTDQGVNHCRRITAAHRSSTGANHFEQESRNYFPSSQVILQPRR